MLESTINGSVVARNISDGEPNQLWNKGKANKEGFFTFKNSKKILTVNFEGKLEVKGKQQKSICRFEGQKMFLEPLKKIRLAIPFDAFSIQIAFL